MLNEKQYKLLKFIDVYINAHGSSPAVHKIHEELEYGPSWQLNILEARGYISKIAGKNNGMTITDLGRQELESKPAAVKDNGQAL